MYSSFSQMKNYCTLSIRLNRLKKGTGTNDYILFIFFRSLISIDFFSLFSLCFYALSLFSVEARNGLGLWFAVGNAGVVVVNGMVVDWWLGLADLGVVVTWACRSCRSRPGFVDLGLGLPISSFSLPA